MGTSDVVIDSWAIGVAKGLRIGPKRLPAVLRVAVVGLLPAPALEDRLLANLALPIMKLRVAKRRAERLAMVVDRKLQLRSTILIPAAVS
jgi:hypothetical protein